MVFDCDLVDFFVMIDFVVEKCVWIEMVNDWVYVEIKVVSFYRIGVLC